MPVLGPRQEAATEELREWWEDLQQRGIGSQVVLLQVPSGWGRSAVLDNFSEAVSATDAPVTPVVRINGRELPDELGLQAAVLAGVLADARARHRVVEMLGLDRLAGGVQADIGVGGLFVSGFAAAPGFLVGGLAVGGAGRLWDDSPAGQSGTVARAARAVAEASTAVPVVLLLDDADRLDPGLAVTLLENLTFRAAGQVLAVVAAELDSGLAKALTSGDRYSLIGRVHTLEADPDMSVQARASLARELCPGLADAAIRRIGQRTQTFAEVFVVTSAEQLAALGPDEDQDSVLAVVDAVIDAKLQREAPSAEAVIVAWAGGVVHSRQAAAALAVLGAEPAGHDIDVARSSSLVRLTDRPPLRLVASVAALPARARHEMAAAFLGEALSLCVDPAAPLVDQVVAGRAAHQVRGDLADDRDRLTRVQRALILGLESVGDLGAATQVADEALAEWPVGGQHDKERDELAAARLRLAHTAPDTHADPIVEQLTAEALAGGAAVGLEARVWAAVSLLNMPGRRESAVRMTDQVAVDLDRHHRLGAPAASWRLLLAFHAGRAGYATIMQRLLTPLLNSDDTDLQDAARIVLHAADGPYADTRLQVIMLEAELQKQSSDDDRLRLHHALADAYGKLGDYHRARDHAQRELPLRIRVQGASHPDTLATRANLAYLTGAAGDAAGARDQYAALLPIREQVLGAEHPDTLATRGNLASWTGQTGDATGAREQYAALLSMIGRVLGAEHPNALATRANLAYLTGAAGDAAEARDQYAALLPIRERVLGAEHPDTLATRANLARFTGAAGDAAGARDQYAALLPDMERVLGAEHPDTLATRANLAYLTGAAGDAAGARDQFAALLSIREQVLGAEHPSTLTTRANIAYLTGAAGDAAGARDQFAALLPIRERIQGAEHPDTLATRANLAYWTGQAEDDAGMV